MDRDPTPSSPAGTGGGPPAGPAVAIKPLVSLKAHRRLGIIAALAIILVGLPVAWVKGKAVYYTEGAVYVSPRFIKNLRDDAEVEFQSNTQYRQFVDQQVKTIKRYDILEAVVAQADTAHWLWPSAFSQQRAVRWLQMNIQARPVPNSYLVRVGVDGQRPDGMAEVINALLRTYLDQQRIEGVYASDQRVDRLREERAKLLEELRASSAQQTRLAQDLGVTSFSTSVLNPFDQLLVSSRKSLYEVRQERIRAEARMASLDARQRTNSSRALEAEIMAEVLEDGGFISLKANLNDRRSELLAKRSSLGPGHPGRVVIGRELTGIDRELERATRDLVQQYRKWVLDQLTTASFQARRTESELAEEVEELASQASWFAARYQEARALEVEIMRLRDQIASVDERIDFLVLESSAPGFVRIEAWALPPEAPIRGGRKRLFMLFIVFGCAVGLALPVAVDLLDPRIMTPQALQRVLGFPAFGWLIQRRDALTADFGRDQLRRMAAQLERDHRREGTHTYLLTSVKSGGGATTLALELARELGDIGLRAVALEVNGLHPDLRYRPVPAGPEPDPAAPEQGAPEPPGLAAALNRGEPVEDVIVAAENGRPDRIPLGQLSGRRHLPALQQLTAVLQKLRERYNIILVDAPPILLSADTELLVPQVEATLLVVGASSVNRGEVRRAAAQLERLDPDSAGAILNGVPVYDGGGYFADLLQEYASGERPATPRWATPWLWK